MLRAEAGPLPGSDLEPFQQRWPWIGADLQTLRDTLRPQASAQLAGQLAAAERVLIDCRGGALLAWLTTPPVRARALVLLVHGLGGCSESVGVRRLAALLVQQGLAVLRLNLRGAGAGRGLATGSYAAQCNADLLPVLRQGRAIAGRLASPQSPLPLVAVGLSLGGTALLNALLACPTALDALVAISAPLDLAASCRQIERWRNRLYVPVVLRRLWRQVAADPAGLSPAERRALAAASPWSLRAFDAAITAPRWGYDSVDAYYAAASPLPQLLDLPTLPPWLLLHAADDPWVPAAPAETLAAAVKRASSRCSVVLTSRGGHNGFHGAADRTRRGASASWSDRLTANWLQQSLNEGINHAAFALLSRP